MLEELDSQHQRWHVNRHLHEPFVPPSLSPNNRLIANQEKSSICFGERCLSQRQLVPWLVLLESDFTVSWSSVRGDPPAPNAASKSYPSSSLGTADGPGKIQGLAESLAAWKVSQNPKSIQHRDELIFFNEKDKRQVYSKPGGKRTSRLHGCERPAGLGSV